MLILKICVDWKVLFLIWNIDLKYLILRDLRLMYIYLHFQEFPIMKIILYTSICFLSIKFSKPLIVVPKILNELYVYWKKTLCNEWTK